MKTLVIIAHPDLSQSIINKSWKEILEKHPENFTIHDLYKVYPDWNIDVAAEQRLVEQYDRILFQFPLYWFSCPPLLRKWMDDVLLYGWAYGSKGDKVKGKEMVVAVSAGIAEEDYRADGKYRYTIADLLRFFELTALYTDMIYLPPFAAYDANPDMTDDALNSINEAYTQFLDALCNAVVPR